MIEKLGESPTVLTNYVDILFRDASVLNKALNTLLTQRLSEFKDISWIINHPLTDLSVFDLKILDRCAAFMNFKGLELLLGKEEIMSRLSREKVFRLREIVSGK